MENIKWNEQFKIRLAKADKTMDLHDIIKVLVVRKIIRKYVNKSWLRVYTEHDLNEGKLIPDIYVEDVKAKSIICYEIQKKLDNDYAVIKTKQYNDMGVPYNFNTLDLIIIPIQMCPDKISEIDKWLDLYVI